MISPGAVIGILGGGQLGRMVALAAARLGYRCHIFCPEPDSPAAQVTASATSAAYDDVVALARFADAVDIVTFEFENVPVETAEFLAVRKPVRPGPDILRISQDRLREKEFLKSMGEATARFRGVEGASDLIRAFGEIGPRAILKTARWGYDGKGQIAIEPGTELDVAVKSLRGAPAILEQRVDFTMEISVIVARGEDGVAVTYVPVENRHVNHILDTTIAPAALEPVLAARAEAMARGIAEKLELIGVLAVEMFVTKGGELLVNELAPRPHNSGHWTIDACVTSQFEQLVRAICGLPLGSTMRHSNAVMKNLIGADVAKWREALDEPNAKLHLYGKTSAPPGRKMGHVTRLLPKRD
jgi:5-(carboxyamino)imidazole ribonucleotide synthase